MDIGNNKKGTKLSTSLLKTLTNYMRGKLRSNVYVEELASESNMSTFHFSRTFKKTTGHSPHKYFMLLRLEKALVLFPTSLSLAEIACESGFSDQAHFTRVFKQHMGVTPAVYRRRRKKLAV